MVLNIKSRCTIAAVALFMGCAEAATLRSGATEIVVAKDAPRTVNFAAKEMKHFLDGVLSCDVPVVTAPSGTRTPIHLGAGSTGFSVDGLERDEFRIVVTGKAVFIAGRDDPKASPERALTRNAWSPNYERATLFGVYEFL